MQETRHPKRLVLASGSPRRAELMREYGYDVEIIEPPVDEPAGLSGTASVYELARAVSHFKAQAVAPLAPDAWIMAGDTIAALDGTLFGKPRDRADAERILSAIAGTTHEVITGVTLLDAETGARQIEHDVTRVTMRPLGDHQMEAYLDTGAWQGKAGAYGIQDRGDAFVESIEGSFTNVVGFPMELVAHMLEAWGFTVPCQYKRTP